MGSEADVPPNKPMVLTVWAASLRSAAHPAAHRPAVQPFSRSAVTGIMRPKRLAEIVVCRGVIACVPHQQSVRFRGARRTDPR